MRLEIGVEPMAYLPRVSGEAGHLGDDLESRQAPDPVHHAAGDQRSSDGQVRPLCSGHSHSGISKAWSESSLRPTSLRSSLSYACTCSNSKNMSCLTGSAFRSVRVWVSFHV